MEGDSLLELNATGTAALRDGVLAYLDLDAITGTEFNRDPGDLSGLRESIRQNGLITPLACTPDGKLLAGRRRFAVLRELGWKRAPFIVIQPRDKAHSFKIMLEENTERKPFTDPEYAGLIEQYDDMMSQEAEEFLFAANKNSDAPRLEGRPPKPWSQKDTAKALGITQPTVSKAIKVAKAVKRHPEWACKEGKQILRLAAREERREENERHRAPPHEGVVLKDIRDADFHGAALVLTDPPYPREYLPLWQVLFRKAYDGLREGGFLVAYAPHIHLPAIFETKNQLTYVWTIAQIHTGARTAYDPACVNIGWKPVLVFVKGKMRPIDYYDDVLQGEGREKDDHEWQQALGEAEALIRIFSNEGDLVVDPFVGSGTTALAARNTGRSFLVSDNDPEAIATTNRRLS